MSSDKRKPSSKKPQKTGSKDLPLPVPSPKEPGLITSFMNMVDIAEAIKLEEEKRKE